MAIKDSMILELLDPEAARRLQQKEAMNQQLAMAQARSPLLAQAYQTAGMLSSSLGGALGTDMRGPTEIRAQRVKDALAQTKGNIIEAAKIVQAEDPAGALALMQYGREMSPKLTRGDVKLGYKTVTVKQDGLDTVKTVQDIKTGAFDEQGNLVGFYEAGGLRRITPEEAQAIQAKADSTGVMKGDIEPLKYGKGTVYLTAGMGQGVASTDPKSSMSPADAARREAVEMQSLRNPPTTTPSTQGVSPGPIKGEVVARMQPVPARPTITPTETITSAPSRTVQTSAEAGAEMQALQQADTSVLRQRLAQLNAVPIPSADQQEEIRRIIAALMERAKINRASR